MWNTDLNSLVNGTASSLFFIDLEDPSNTFVIPAGKTVVDIDLIFPWCINSLEVRTKAFRIHQGTSTSGPVILFLFQNFVDDTVYYIPGSLAIWSLKHDVGEGPSSHLDISIDSNGIPTGTASTSASALTARVLEKGNDTRAESDVQP